MWHSGWFFGPIMMVLFLALTVAAIVLLVRWLVRSDGRPLGPRTDLLSILQERFARGEIGKDEYEEHSSVLRQQ